MPGRRLSSVEREEISRGVAEGMAYAEIARALSRPTSTVSREVARNGGRCAYRAWRGQMRAVARGRRRRRRKLLANRELRQAVDEGLAKRWSPAQVAGRLRLEHPDDPRWWVSHETIYRVFALNWGA